MGLVPAAPRRAPVLDGIAYLAISQRRGIMMPYQTLTPTRRQTIALTAGGLIASLIGPRNGAQAAAGDTLTLAYNVNLPSFDPTVGPSAVNPTIQAIYRSVFDQYIGQ